MLKTIWNLVRTGVIVFGVLLSFFAILEVLRAYQTLYNFHPAAAYVFLALIAGVFGWLIFYVWSNLAVFPKALKAPQISDFENATDRQLRKYVRYLGCMMQRMADNQNLSDSHRGGINDWITRLEGSYAASDRTAYLELIKDVEQDHIQPMLKELDELAARQVRDSMRDIMIGVTLSPYKSADLMIVLYRNIVMVVRIVKVYRVRPALSEQVRIFSDIINVIATVNYINMGKNLIEGLGSRVPGIGRFVDDIAQGVGAGFMTTIAGHAAMARCRAFRGWNETEAKKHLLSHVGDFYNDVKDIFFKDVWGGIRHRSGLIAAEAGEKVADAIDETGSVLDHFVRYPIKAVSNAGQAVVSVSTSSTKAVVGTTAKGVDLVGKGIRKTGSIFTRPFSKKNIHEKQ